MTSTMPPGHEGQIGSYCPRFQSAVELIGRRWTGAIVRSLLAGSVRFSDILAAVPGLSDRLLSERLRELETAGVVDRVVYPESPVRIEYRLTEKGRELQAIIEAIDGWAEKWATKSALSNEQRATSESVSSASFRTHSD